MTHYPHFGSVVSKLEKLLQRTKYADLKPHVQAKYTFLQAVLPQLHAVKDSWRNKVTHADNKIVPIDLFNPEMARDVYQCTRMLMNKLAEELP